MSENLQYGGQAVIEGVMMRSPRWFTIACRKPDGSITVKTEAVENTILALKAAGHSGVFVDPIGFLCDGSACTARLSPIGP